jgi:hypothetical protein
LGVLKNLYTCLREAAPAKAGRNLLAFCYYVSKHITEATLGDRMLPIKNNKEPLCKGLEVHPTAFSMQH